MTDADPNAAFEHAVAQRIRERDLMWARWALAQRQARLADKRAGLFELGWAGAMAAVARACFDGEVP